jgi:hypothetical protein
LVASIAGNRATAHRILASSGEPTARWGAARNPRANVRPAYELQQITRALADRARLPTQILAEASST